MSEVIGVKFRNVGKVYYFAPADFEIRYHDHVIVETARGLEYGTVVLTRVEVADEKIPQPLKPVLRMATPEDTAHEAENRAKEKEAYRICKKKIAEHELDMKLIEAEYTFDDSKVLFYFTAEGRIDFRELVKDLAGIFRTRIELRQIGVRDETKLLGGMGSCGRPLCCHTWLGEFAPVSIKMAKDQNLSLNPTKISGTCGRLMCCLKNESDMYNELNKGLPNKGDYVTTPDGNHGDVVSVNILRQTVKVIVELDDDEKEMQEFPVSEITFIPKSKKPKFLAKEASGSKESPKDASKESGKDGKKLKKPAMKDEEVEIPEFIEKADIKNYVEERGEGEGSGRKRRRGAKGKGPSDTQEVSQGSEGEPSEAHEGSKKNRNRRNKNRGGADSQPDGSGEAENNSGKRDQKDRRENGTDEQSQKHNDRNRNDRTRSEQGKSDRNPDGGENASGDREGGDHEHKARRRRRRPHKGGKPEGAGNEGGAPSGEQ